MTMITIVATIALQLLKFNAFLNVPKIDMHRKQHKEQQSCEPPNKSIKLN